MKSEKLYEEFIINSDIIWEESKFHGVYRAELSQFDGYDLNHPVINLVELSKFIYSGDDCVSGYITNMQYFILDDYLYINFGDSNPNNCDSKLQLAQLDSVDITLSGEDLLLLVVDSRTNNSTYVTDSTGNKLADCFKSKAPYVRVYALDPALGSVTINNPGVASYYLFPIASSSGGGGGGGTVDNIEVNGVNGTVTNKIASVDIDSLIADAEDENEVYGDYSDGQGGRVKKALATKEWVQNNPITDNSKLNSSSAATQFNTTDTFNIGDYVSYNGNIYKCVVQHTGDWDADDFELVSLTSPDATLSVDDVTGELTILDSTGTVIWTGTNLSRYRLVTSSGTTISAQSNSAIGIEDANSSDTTYTISLPNPLAHKINDLVIDIHAGGTGNVVLVFSGVDTTYKLLLKSGTDLNSILTVESGNYARFSITQSSLTSSSLPVYIMNRVDLELYSSVTP